MCDSKQGLLCLCEGVSLCNLKNVKLAMSVLGSSSGSRKPAQLALGVFVLRGA